MALLDGQKLNRVKLRFTFLPGGTTDERLKVCLSELGERDSGGGWKSANGVFLSGQDHIRGRARVATD